MCEDRIVGLDKKTFDQLVGVDVDKQRVVGTVSDRMLAQEVDYALRLAGVRPAWMNTVRVEGDRLRFIEGVTGNAPTNISNPRIQRIRLQLARILDGQGVNSFVVQHPAYALELWNFANTLSPNDTLLRSGFNSPVVTIARMPKWSR